MEIDLNKFPLFLNIKLNQIEKYIVVKKRQIRLTFYCGVHCVFFFCMRRKKVQNPKVKKVHFSDWKHVYKTSLPLLVRGPKAAPEAISKSIFFFSKEVCILI